MITKTSASYGHQPLIFIILPLLMFFLFKGFGVIFFIGILTPIFKYIGKVFTHYSIEENKLIIKRLFNKREIKFSDIQYLDTLKSTTFQKFILAYPTTYQLIAIKNGWGEDVITPQHPLVYDQAKQTYYFQD